MPLQPQSREVVQPSVTPKPARLPQYHVVLLDDDDHTYDYVIEMLQRLFGLPAGAAYIKAVEVDRGGRSVVDTTTWERAELKRDQIHAYGKDWRIQGCRGSMRACIEPAS